MCSPVKISLKCSNVLYEIFPLYLLILFKFSIYFRDGTNHLEPLNKRNKCQSTKLQTESCQILELRLRPDQRKTRPSNRSKSKKVVSQLPAFLADSLEQ